MTITSDDTVTRSHRSSQEERTPGRQLAWAVRLTEADDVRVDLTTSLLSSYSRSRAGSHHVRTALRHLVNVATTSRTEVPYVREQGTSDDDLPETLRPELHLAWLTGLTVEVALPDAIISHPRLLEEFVDHRVLARVAAREDNILLHGSHDGCIPGLLTAAQTRQCPDKRGTCDIDSLLSLAVEVEEAGGTCDGILVHPHLYWKLAERGLLSRLYEANVRVCRTRMIPRTQAVLGDFHTGATILESPVSSLTLHRRPDSADTVQAHGRIGFAIRLPQHFILTQLCPDTSTVAVRPRRSLASPPLSTT